MLEWVIRLVGGPDVVGLRQQVGVQLVDRAVVGFAAEVYEECATGERLCGGCKEQAAELMAAFLEEHQERREEAQELLADLGVDLDGDRR